MLLDLNVSATSRLGLEPLKDGKGGYLYGGIVPALIVDFHLTTQKHEKGEFKDLDVPVLQVELENFKLNANDPDRFLTYAFKVIGSKKLVAGSQDVYENRTVEEINNDSLLLWKSIKHFLENLTGSPNYRNIANIPKTDTTEYLDLPDLGAPAERLAKYTKFFNYLVKFVSGDGTTTKSQIVDANSKPLPIWVKVLPNYDSDSKRAKKYFTISRYIGQGVFEPMKVEKELPVGTPKIIRVKPTESLELVATTIGTPAGGGIPAGAGKIDPSVASLLS